MAALHRNSVMYNLYTCSHHQTCKVMGVDVAVILYSQCPVLCCCGTKSGTTKQQLNDGIRGA